MPMDLAKYPPNWEEIAGQIKRAAGWHCQKCGRLHDPTVPAWTLTVHHLDHDPANSAPSNLVALCAACHLKAEGEWLRAQRKITINREQIGLAL